MNAERLTEIEETWLGVCPACDAGLPEKCTHPKIDYRNVIAELVEALKEAPQPKQPKRTRRACKPPIKIETFPLFDIPAVVTATTNGESHD